jgi:hypothetical protein
MIQDEEIGRKICKLDDGVKGPLICVWIARLFRLFFRSITCSQAILNSDF